MTRKHIRRSPIINFEDEFEALQPVHMLRSHWSHQPSAIKVGIHATCLFQVFKNTPNLGVECSDKVTQVPEDLTMKLHQ